MDLYLYFEEKHNMLFMLLMAKLGRKNVFLG